MSISIAILKEAIEIKESILQLETRLAKILGGNAIAAASVEEISIPVPGKRGRRKMSAAARAKISAAQKARWAVQLGGAPAKSAEPAKPGKRGRPRKGLSPEGRARIIAAQKARWAKKGKDTAPVADGAKPVKKKRKLSAEGRARIVAALKKRWAAQGKGK